MEKLLHQTPIFYAMLLVFFFGPSPRGLNAQWLEIDGLPGSTINQLKQGQHTVFASGEERPKRSTDGGEHWEDIPGLPPRITFATDGANVLASTSGSVWPFELKLFQSADDGFSWTEVVIEPMDTLGPTFQIFGSYVYAQKIIGSGTFRTKDHGANWEFVSDAEFDFTPDGGKMYRSSGNALLASADGGFFWDTLAVLPKAVALQLKQGDEIVATHWPLQGDGSLYYSKDAGNSWTTLSIPPAEERPYDIYAIHQAKIYAFRRMSSYAMVADLPDGAFQPLPLVEGSNTERSVISVGEKLLRATLTSGVTLSSDGSIWSKAKGINSGGLLQTFDGRMYATPGTGLYQLQADKQQWELIAPDFELRQIIGFTVKENYLTLASRYGSVWVSSNGGQTFEPGKNEDGSLAYGLYHIAASGAYLFGWDYGGYLGLAQPRFSVDHGLTWKSLSGAIGGLFVDKMDVSNGQMYITDTLGLLYHWNAGTQFFDQISSTPIPFQGTDELKYWAPIYVQDETYLVTEPSAVDHWNGFAAHTFVSTDAGQSWSLYPIGLSAIRSVGDTLFAAQVDHPLVISTDQTASWQPFSEGIEDNAFGLELLDGEVFASTSKAIYRRKTNGELPTVPTVEPGRFTGFIVAPNPFSDHISVPLEEPSAVKAVRLLDVLGQRVELAQLAYFNAEIEVSGLAHLPPGIYFLEIEAKGTRTTEKLMKF